MYNNGRHHDEFEEDDGWGGVVYKDKMATQDNAVALLQRAKRITVDTPVRKVS
jgi:hypothetical protein